MQNNPLDTLAPFFSDPSITDILINGAGAVFVEKNGRLTRTEFGFTSEKDVRALAEAIALQSGRPLDAQRPLLDTRLADGSRVNIVCPPLSVDGTTISIRRHSHARFTLNDMSMHQNMPGDVADLLKIIGRCRLNVIVSGGTGAGKTTLLNAIAQHADDVERIVTIEDTAELSLNKPHVVRMETRPLPEGEMPDALVTSRDLVRNALRMRPDRIIVGEVRGGEAFDMLQAMNTGHEGSLTTLHSNHPRDALTRLENMVAMAVPSMPLRALRSQITSAIHVIVQISRSSEGARRITHISELCGMEGDVIVMQDLVEYQQATGTWKWSNVAPRFSRRVAYWGEGPRLQALFSRR